MTTHDFARLLESLRDGLGPALKADAANGFGDAAEILRAEPERSLKDLLKQLRKPTAAKNGGPNTNELIADIRSIREGRGGSPAQVAAALEKLKLAELKTILTAFDKKAKKTIADNKAIVLSLFAETAAAPTLDDETAYRTFNELRESPGLSIADLRSRFEQIRQMPKSVLESVARRLGYQFDGSKEEVANRLLDVLERSRMSDMRGELINAAS